MDICFGHNKVTGKESDNNNGNDDGKDDANGHDHNGDDYISSLLVYGYQVYNISRFSG